MKTWRLTPLNEEPASIYITSDQEANYYIDLIKNKFYQKQKIQQSFQPTLVYNLKEKDIGQILFGEQEFWIFTEKAKQVLDPLLDNSVEYLSLVCKNNINKKISIFRQIRYRKAYKPLIEMIHSEPHYLINILNIQSLDVINFANSDFEYDEEKQEIFMTETLALDPQKIENIHLFKIMNHGKALQMATFVSDEFRKIVEANNLTGLKFIDKPEDEGGNLVWSQSS